MLARLGVNGALRTAAAGVIVGRIAHPASERETHRWLQQRSGLGELLGVDFEIPAAGLSDPVPAVEPTVAITFKLPVSTVRAIRAYARRSGLSLGQVVTQAVTALLDSIRQRRG